MKDTEGIEIESIRESIRMTINVIINLDIPRRKKGEKDLNPDQSPDKTPLPQGGQRKKENIKKKDVQNVKRVGVEVEVVRKVKALKKINITDFLDLNLEIDIKDKKKHIIRAENIVKMTSTKRKNQRKKLN